MNTETSELWPTQDNDYIQNYGSLERENVDKYEIVETIGKGNYGVVYKAFEKGNSENIVAIKQLDMYNPEKGFPITVLREIDILRTMKHPNIIKLLELCQIIPSNGPSILLVMEYCKYDLDVLIKNLYLFIDVPEIKHVMFELLQGIHYLHSNNVLHRDLKPVNILVNNIGDVKLGDFGLARYASTELMSNMVVTRWYRPPELLFGTSTYSSAVDMWSLGCIMGELYTRSPILRGATDQGQLLVITNLCGSITSNVWPEVENYPLYRELQLPLHIMSRIKDAFPMIVQSLNGIKLFERLMTLDPSLRISAEEALKHEYFCSAPLAVNFKDKLTNLPNWDDEDLNISTETESRTSIQENEDNNFNACKRNMQQKWK